MDSNASGIWYREVDSKAWVLYKNVKGKAFLKIVEPKKSKNTSTKKVNTKKEGDLILKQYTAHSVSVNMPKNEMTRKPEYETKSEQPKPTSTANTIKKSNTTSKTNKKTSGNIAKEPNDSGEVKPVKDKKIQNAESYPPVIETDKHGMIWYDWSIHTDQLLQTVQAIKENLNVPSAYSRYDITDLTNTKFNRYKIKYPDNQLPTTMSYVVFTRPDLNLFDDNTKQPLDQVLNNPQLYYIYRNNPAVLEQLSLVHATDNKFIPLLTNQATALDIPDEVIETGEMGETWAGHKMKYAKNSVRSMTAGSVSVKFPETYDTAITQMLQAWCTYENEVYMGTLIPKTDYCAYKILDYACDIYYFLMDREWNIKFWSIYYGAFPTNVNKSIFSYDMGSDSGGAEVNVSFDYFEKVDSDPDCLVNFNNIGGGVTSDTKYRVDIDPNIGLGGGGTTWSGAPFIETVQTVRNSRVVDEFKFRFRA